MGFLLYALPISIGFIVGYFLTMPVNIAVSGAAVCVAGFMLWTTRNAEIGALIGVIAAVIAVIFILSQWATILLSHNIIGAIDLSWLFRK